MKTYNRLELFTYTAFYGDYRRPKSNPSPKEEHINLLHESFPSLKTSPDIRKANICQIYLTSVGD